MLNVSPPQIRYALSFSPLNSSDYRKVASTQSRVTGSKLFFLPSVFDHEADFTPCTLYLYV